MYYYHFHDIIIIRSLTSMNILQVVRLASETFNYGPIDRATARTKKNVAERFPGVGRKFHRLGLPPKVQSQLTTVHHFPLYTAVLLAKQNKIYSGRPFLTSNSHLTLCRSVSWGRGVKLHCNSVVLIVPWTSNDPSYILSSTMLY